MLFRSHIEGQGNPKNEPRMFKFVHITHLDDVRHAISEDFFLAERDWGFVINYHINAFPEIKDDMSDEDKALEYARREFRGIKFDKQGKLIARPFHKFFNWGEKEAEMAHLDRKSTRLNSSH